MKIKSLGAGLLAAGLLSQTASAQITGDIVRIGVLSDMSGTYSDLSGKGSVWAANKAIKDYLATKPGLKVEVVSADHQNKGDVAANTARQWYDVGGVDAIVDLVTSSTALAVNNIAKEKNKVALVSGAAASDLTGKLCTPNTVHWTYDTWALANGTGNAVVKTGGKTWYFLTADYAFGHALERDVTAVVTGAGGKVLGGVRHPLSTQDFSSFLLQAQASKAKVIGLANAGQDTINSIKQAGEFGITKAGQRLAGLLVFSTDVAALTLPVAQGLVLTEAFYWDLNDETRAWTKRFRAKKDKIPSMLTVGVYSSTLHYLKAVQAAGTDEPKAVMAKMREIPVNDVMTKNGKLREDGRLERDMYLFQVKSPAESKSKDDIYKLIATVPGNEAYRPMKDGKCPFVKN